MNIIRIIALAAVCLLVSPEMQAQNTTSNIKVSGNCGMCQKKIEAAALSAGARKAHWDEATKVLTVKYKAAQSSDDAIQKAVAAVGYDTEKYTADMETYHKLHSCCQYDNKRNPETNR